ncbi:MAG: universal stress protein, partial [Gammaproteobacteria bacterium]|nr:universal stress protein [Gammaproteobacteria bacterium]NIR97711.1 universal stress protein [Gammaproteobacteria bacterium]NIT63436.1 universal stress protein [Gammaproteobacteria bacterium]NIV20349.1 universal stress protein [Gammaproteobacteria bacterium]NIY32016.1 universal stress protein [Gammaproteobacteria bacterium]
MLKRILVPLDTSEFTDAAIRMAAALANREQAVVKEPVQLEGLGIVDMDQIPAGRFASVVPRDEILSEANTKTTALLEHFTRTAKEHGLPAEQLETKRVEGSPFRQIVRESVFCDLIVMGEKCSFPPVSQDYETMHHLYHEVSRPLIITEQDFKGVDTVVMLMDGTAPASRMMYNYVHLEPFPGAKVVMVYSREEETQYGLTEYFQRVEGFLRDYHLDVRTEVLDGETEDALPRVVNKVGAQVLALGIHREHFLHRFSDPLNIRQVFARRLLHSMSA